METHLSNSPTPLIYPLTVYTIPLKPTHSRNLPSPSITLHNTLASPTPSDSHSHSLFFSLCVEANKRTDRGEENSCMQGKRRKAMHAKEMEEEEGDACVSLKEVIACVNACI